VLDRSAPLIWISVCHQDEAWLLRLRRQLHPAHHLLVAIADSLTLDAGVDRPTSIRRSVELASVAVLMISPDFLLSTDVYELEVRTLLRRQASGQLSLFPLLTRPCAWDAIPWLRNLQPRPSDRRFLAARRDSESILAELAREILSSAQVLPSSAKPFALSNSPELNPDGAQIAYSSSSDKIARDQLEALERLTLEREHRRSRQLSTSDLDEPIAALFEQLLLRRLPRPGDVVAGARLELPISTGSFSTVWRSHDCQDGRPMATKVFQIERAAHGIMLFRFRRSIKVIQLLQEHHQVPETIVRIRQISDDRLAYTMDYVPGGTLENIRALRWSLEQKLAAFERLCEAVSFAHRLNVLHRDIKPANVLLTSTGLPVLIDFDLLDAKIVTGDTHFGGLGTHDFSAPEQLQQGDSATERSDIYSLGQVLSFMLTEKPTSGYFWLEGIPVSIAAVIKKATSSDPQLRHASVQNLLSELRAWRSRGARYRATLQRAHDRDIFFKSFLVLFALIGIFFLLFAMFAGTR